MSEIGKLEHGTYVTERILTNAASQMKKVGVEEAGSRTIGRHAIDGLRDIVEALRALPNLVTDSQYVANNLSYARLDLDEAIECVGERYRFADSNHPAAQAIPKGIAALVAKHSEIVQHYALNSEYAERLGPIVGALEVALADLEDLVGAGHPNLVYGGSDLKTEISEFLQIRDGVAASCQEYRDAL